MNSNRFALINLFCFNFRDIWKNLKRHKDEDLIKGQAVKNQKVFNLMVSFTIFIGYNSYYHH